jgi:hypothetical protein
MSSSPRDEVARREDSQRGPGRHQRSAGLLVGQPVQAAVKSGPVFIEKHLELGPGWLIDDVLG